MKEPNPDDLERIDPSIAGRRGPGAALVAFAVVVVLTVVFVLRNRDRTQLDFVVFEVHARVWTSLAVSIALGIVLDRLFLRFWRRRRRRRHGQ